MGGVNKSPGRSERQLKKPWDPRIAPALRKKKKGRGGLVFHAQWKVPFILVQDKWAGGSKEKSGKSLKGRKRAGKESRGWWREHYWRKE